MTMLVRTLASLAGVAALFAGAQVARADDVIRLKANAGVNAPAVTLGYDGKSDTELARYGYRGGYGGFRGGYGGYRGYGHVGYYGGYRGGFYGGYRGYYGGYRGGYGGYYRPFYANYYRPYYYGGYGGYGYASYYSPYYYNSYYATPYYYSTPYYYDNYYGCSNATNIVTTVNTVTPSVYAYQQPYLPSVTPYGSTPQVYGGGYNNGYNGLPQQGISGYNGNQLPVMPPVQQPNNGTYPYDGGPNAPVQLPQQLPQQDSAPAKFAPQAPTTLRLVSTPAPKTQPASQFSFPAYGEDSRASGFAIDRTAPAKKTTR